MTELIPDITFRQLAVLVAVARQGSFGAAANHLGISQVSVSKHMAALERASRMPVFERTAGRASKLTMHGAALLDFAETTLTAYREVRVTEASKSSRTLIRIAASEATIDLNFHPHLADFCVQHPNIDVHFIPVTSTLSVLPELVEQKVDLAFLALAEKPTHVSGELLGEIRFGLYASPSLTRMIRSEDPAARPYPIVWPPQGGPISRVIVGALKVAGLEPYRVVRRLQRLSTGVDLARLGAGICCITSIQARPFVEIGEIVQVGAICGIYGYAIPISQKNPDETSAAQRYFGNILVRDLIAAT